MSTQITIKEPVYYHREFNNDFGRKSTDSWNQTCRETGAALLPFLSLYKPLSFALTVGAGALRTFTHGYALKESWNSTHPHARTVIRPFCVFQTVVSGAALVATLRAHPLGMMMTTGLDILNDIVRLTSNMHEGKTRAAFENSLHILNNAFYFVLFLKGGAGLAILSLALQTATSLYHSATEYQKGNYIQAAAHFALTGLRANQMAWQIDRYRDIQQNPIVAEGTIDHTGQHVYTWHGKKYPGLRYFSFHKSNSESWDVRGGAQAFPDWKAGDHIVIQRTTNRNYQPKYHIWDYNEPKYFESYKAYNETQGTTIRCELSPWNWDKIK